MLRAERPVLIVQNAFRRTGNIFILTAFQRPEEQGEPQPAQCKRDRNQIPKDVHAASSAGRRRVDRRPSRRALATTMIEDPDIAKAATNGVTYPAMAIGSRSEERRVGKEWVSPCRSRGAQYHYKKKRNAQHNKTQTDQTT